VVFGRCGSSAPVTICKCIIAVCKSKILLPKVDSLALHAAQDGNPLSSQTFPVASAHFLSSVQIASSVPIFLPSGAFPSCVGSSVLHPLSYERFRKTPAFRKTARFSSASLGYTLFHRLNPKTVSVTLPGFQLSCLDQTAENAFHNLIVDP
jgi:hypothetical protein